MSAILLASLLLAIQEAPVEPPPAATVSVVVDGVSGALGTVAFNCRVRANRSLDDCVVADTEPHSIRPSRRAIDAALRSKAPASSPEFSRIRVIVSWVSVPASSIY